MSGPHRGAERFGDQLRSETDAEIGSRGRSRRATRSHFGREVRVTIDLIDVHSAREG